MLPFFALILVEADGIFGRRAATRRVQNSRQTGRTAMSSLDVAFKSAYAFSVFGRSLRSRKTRDIRTVTTRVAQTVEHLLCSIDQSELRDCEMLLLMASLIVIDRIDGNPVTWRCSQCRQVFSVAGKLTTAERHRKITAEFRAHSQQVHATEEAESAKESSCRGTSVQLG